MKISRWLPFASALGLIPAALPAQGSSLTLPADRWEWTIAPSALVPSFSGSYSIAGLDFPGQVTSSSGGASVYLQARSRDWAFVVDGLYLSLDQPAVSQCCNPGGGGVDSGGTQGTQWSLQALALRCVGTPLELAFGVSANRVEATVHVWGITGGGPVGTPFTVTSSQTQQWALPVVGARWTPLDHDRWRASLFGEVGFLSSDNKMWQLLPSLGYGIGSVTEIVLQYRMMSTVYRAGANYEFNYDVSLSGPELAVALRF